MGSRIVSTLTCASIPLLASSAPGETFVVDRQGGAGSQFVDIQSAIDAAMDGDLIVVQPGKYVPFTIDGKALTILGQDGVVVRYAAPSYTWVTIRNVGGGDAVALIDFELVRIEVRDCQGTVILDSLDFVDEESLWVDLPAIVELRTVQDVRMHRCLVRHTKTIGTFLTAERESPGVLASSAQPGSGSRVEIVQCAVYGRDGKDAYFDPDSYSHGGPALEADAGSRMHVALSDAYGGSDGVMCSTYLPPTNGGDGLAVLEGAAAVVAGIGEESIQGGRGGRNDRGDLGVGGFGCLLVSEPALPAVLRHSDVSLVGGFDITGTTQAAAVRSCVSAGVADL